VIVSRVAVAGTVAFPERVELVLPERGVVLLSGDNGHGKSSLIEAVAWACWGLGLRTRADGRPAQPWVRELGARIEVDVGEHGVLFERRARGATRIALAWKAHAPPDNVVIYENSHKGYAALSAVVGDFDVWRRACVFSSADAAQFSVATDAERKDLIEEMVGLGVFERALRCSASALSAADLARRDTVLVRGHREDHVRTASAQLERVLERQRAASSTMPMGGPEELRAAAIAAGARGVDDVWSARRAEYDGLRDVLGREAQALAVLAGTCAYDAESLGEQLKRQQSVADDADLACRACGRAITPAERGARRDAALVAVEELSRRRDRLATITASVTVDEAAIAAALCAVRGERDVYEQAVRAMMDYCRAFAHARAVEDEIAAGRARLVELELDAEEARVGLARHTHAVRVERAAAEAIRGTRTAVLAAAIVGLNVAANAYLARLGATYRIRLEPTTTTKGGEERDRIALHVDGAGNGEGYGGCSSGERRRIDVALLFGVGDLARGSSPPGTLWLDEVFAHLDVDGKDAATELVRDLARDRCVVVVEHDPEFVRGLRADKHVRVERGRLIDV
jgi:recombinational DNA repair ATPase RecF